ncbi:DoxX family protein [Streptomyces sp. BH097]|uniref:DoxX family protein n=1 Tax=unclassified Streptomyces TaxID=2593676 RepID=UPI003BB5B2B0
MDTRTPRTPSGDRTSGFDEGPALSMVKVPCDPAQVIVNHASFRVRLPTAQQSQLPRISRHLSATGVAGADAATTRIPVITAAGTPGARRRRPVVMNGGDLDTSGLLQGARRSGEPDDGGATQVIPRVDERDFADDLGLYRDSPPAESTQETPTVGPWQGETDEPTRILPRMRQSGSAFEETGELEQVPYGDGEFDVRIGSPDGADGESTAARRYGPVRHAYYPGRRMNLGVVLLPLRVFLGFISIYAGMGKLCDPVYFDGGERGSMVKWLHSLHPWALAEPLRDWALQHPVGAGLVIAFLQVIVGVLTVLGLWQRLAASIGALLSAALLVTVSWKTVPAYDAPDIIYLAAWSPLIIAGAPVYSIDGRLAGGAWRRLGPRAALWDLRNYVLRRGTVVATLVIGGTLLIGSVLGGAVRDADRVTAPGPGDAPRNEVPGSPLPSEPGSRSPQRQHTKSPSASSSNAPTQGTTASPSGSPSSAGATAGASATSGTTTTPTQGTTAGQAPPQESAPQQQQPPSSSGGSPSSGGTSSGGTDSKKPGLVGGLLGE